MKLKWKYKNFDSGLENCLTDISANEIKMEIYKLLFWIKNCLTDVFANEIKMEV